MIRSILYDCIYSRYPNYFLRNINRFIQEVIPVRLPPSGKLTIPLKDGQKINFFTNQTDHVSFLVFWNGLYQYEYVDIFEDLIRGCRTFIDIGSNGGLYSLVAAKANPQIQILAFDPTDAAHYFQKKNFEANHVSSNVHSYQLAVSDTEGEVTLFKVKNPKYKRLKYNLGGASGFMEKPKHYEESRVRTISIDHFLEKNHPAFAPDFIKIDAENAEALIIRGLQKVIRKDKPVIVCEILFDSGLDELEKAFKSVNYRFYFHLDHGLKEVESLAAKQNFPEVKNCFFVPDEKKALIEKWIL